MLAERGVEKGAQGFKVSPRNGRTLLWLEGRTRGMEKGPRKNVMGDKNEGPNCGALSNFLRMVYLQGARVGWRTGFPLPIQLSCVFLRSGLVLQEEFTLKPSKGCPICSLQELRKSLSHVSAGSHHTGAVRNMCADSSAGQGKSGARPSASSKGHLRQFWPCSSNGGDTPALLEGPISPECHLEKACLSKSIGWGPESMAPPGPRKPGLCERGVLSPPLAAPT